MYDPTMNLSFNPGLQDNYNPQWWHGDPIWVTAERQNVKSGIVYWPGSEVKINGVCNFTNYLVLSIILS